MVRGPCLIHCPAKASGAGMIAGAALAVYVLWQVAVALAAAAGVAVVVVAGLAVASRLLRARLSVVHWPSMQAVARAEVQRAALPAPPRAIGAPARVWEDAIIDSKEAVR